MFNISNDKELRECFIWKITQSFLKKEHQKKGMKPNFLDYQLQLNKAYQLLKINEEI